MPASSSSPVAPAASGGGTVPAAAGRAAAARRRLTAWAAWLAARFANGRALPVVLFAAFIVFHATTIAPRIVRTRPLPFDTYRDVACARSILNGQGVFRDPTIAGEYGWYSPLNPWLFAGLSKLTGVDVFLLYAYSPLFINIFAPIVFYVFAFLIAGRWTAFTATLLIPCVPWLKTHLLVMGMPSIHAVPLVLVVLVTAILFSRRRMGPGRAAVLGALMGIAILHHSLSGMIAYASVCLMLLIRLGLVRTRPALVATAVAVTIPILLAAPYLLPNLLRPKLNPAPLDYVAPELASPAFTVFIPNRALCVFFWSCLPIGLFALRRRFRRPGVLLLVCCLLVTAGGQLPGYIRILAVANPAVLGGLRRLPCLLPHEFQWFFQLFALVPVAYGIGACARIMLKRHRRLIHLALTLLLIVPGYADLRATQMRYLVLHLAPKPRYIAWIEQHTPKDAVIVSSHPWLDYREVQPFTARRILHHYPAHMNFNVDVAKRGERQARLLYHADRAEAERIVAEFGLHYLVLDRKTTSADRLAFFRNTFAVAYEDGMVIVHRLRQPAMTAPERR